MYRWFVILLLIGLATLTATAQVSTMSVDLGNGQTAQIIPLYRNFDYFYYQVAMGTGGNYGQCADAWTRMIDSFGVDVREDERFQYMRRWDVTADRIDDDTMDVVAETLATSAAILPGRNIDVCLVPAPPDSRSMSSADDELYAIASDDVIIVALGGLSRGWEIRLANVIAHEYHHTVRNISEDRDLVPAEGDDAAESDRTLSLLERVVSEGMAVVFAQQITPEYRDPLYTGLTAQQEFALWAEILPQLASGNLDIQQRYVLGDGRNVPPNAGYTIGYHMMQSYIANNPDVSLAEWTIMNSVEVYEASGYNPQP